LSFSRDLRRERKAIEHADPEICANAMICLAKIPLLRECLFAKPYAVQSKDIVAYEAQKLIICPNLFLCNVTLYCFVHRKDIRFL